MAAADRHLLFGLLALQNGIINQGQLVAAFHAWTLDKSRSLADHLEDRGDLTGAKRALLEALAEVHLDAHGGDVEKSLAAVPAGKSTQESLARIGGPEVEATLARVGSGSTEGDPDHERTMTFSVGTATSDGQRFRVLRPHACGGLGAVFVALDGELNREVALKQILDHHADDPVSRQRFLIEAEITGGLEHPGIVPVYGLGTYDGGRPYYAMRFIRGDSLKEAIEQFHVMRTDSASPSARKTDRTADPTGLELRRLLRRFTDVCNAIEYAHSRGVLHRDIKPGNVIVGKHGETLVVDWGLAKPLGKVEASAGGGERALMPSSASGSAETLPGSAMGTPAYMSPEQAAGDLDRLGPRSDVYSLGATLSCLLTGKAPFDGDVGEVLRKVRKGDFARPRQLDPSIDPALEMVCLKAMATRPEDRYASCRALAEDVERWAADEPVTAWREPLARRARRWAKQNRTAVAAAAAAVLVALAGTAAVLAVQTRANVLLKSTNKNLDDAQKATAAERDAKERQRAGKEAEAAKAVAINRFLIDKILVQADPKNNSVNDKITVLQALDNAAKGVAGSFPDQPEVEAEVRMAIGATYRGLGAFEKARDQHRAAYEILRLAKTDLDPSTLEARSDFAFDLERLGRSAEAREILDAVLRSQRGVLAVDHTDTLTTFDRLATSIASLGRYDEAEAIQRELLAARRRVLGPDHSLTLAACNNLGLTLWSGGKFAEAEAIQLEVVAARGRIFGREHPDTLTTANNLGLTLWSAGKYREAEAIHRELLAIKRRVLGPDHPSTLTTVNNLALTLDSKGDYPVAEEMKRDLLAARRRVQGNDHPATISAMHILAFTINARGRHGEAVSMQREVVATRGRVLGPVHPETLMAVNNLAVYLDKDNRSAEAEGLVKEVLDRVREGQIPRAQEVRALTLVRGRLLTRMGRSSEAEPLLREALANSRKALPPGDWRIGFAESLTGDCLLAQGRHAEAEPLLLSGARAMTDDSAAGAERRRDALDRVVALYGAWGKPAEAAIWRLKQMDAAVPPDPFAPP